MTSGCVPDGVDLSNKTGTRTRPTYEGTRTRPNVTFIRNIGACSRNHWWCGKALSTTYSECVSVTLVMQHAMRMCRIILSSMAYLAAGAAFEGGKWGDRPRPRSWEGPALQAYESVKLYSPVNWKCWYMLRLKSFFKVKFRSVVLGCLLYRNRLHVAPKRTPVARP